MTNANPNYHQEGRNTQGEIERKANEAMFAKHLKIDAVGDPVTMRCSYWSTGPHETVPEPSPEESGGVTPPPTAFR